jgi:hypothetical protein
MAVMMSTMAQHGVSQPELQTLLASIRTSQAAEIEQMRAWYHAWYGAPVPATSAMPGHDMGNMQPGHGVMNGAPRSGSVSGAGRDGHLGGDSASLTATIRALTPAEVQLIRNGEGAGLARAAELNNIPGPRHVLEASEELGLSADQLTRIQAVFEVMRTHSLEAGGRFLGAQEAFETDLRAGQITTETLPERALQVDRLRTELAVAHLDAHLRTTELLTADQRERYAQLRGYR